MGATILSEKLLAKDIFTQADSRSVVSLYKTDDGTHYLRVSSTEPEWHGKHVTYRDDIESWIAYVQLCDTFEIEE